MRFDRLEEVALVYAFVPYILTNPFPPLFGDREHVQIKLGKKISRQALEGDFGEEREEGVH